MFTDIYIYLNILYVLSTHLVVEIGVDPRDEHIKYYNGSDTPYILSTQVRPNQKSYPMDNEN